MLKGNWLVCLACSLLWLASVNARAQTTILLETFEGAFPGSWSVGDANASGTTAYWRDLSVPFGSIGRAPDDSGYIGYCAGTGYGGSSSSPTYQDNMDGYMSRSINLSGYSSATLTFWYAIPSIESCCDRLEVYIDDTVVWSTGTAAPGSWNQITVNLNSYVGSSYTLKFNFHSDSSVHYEGAYLDNILLTGTPNDPNDQISEAISLGSVTETLTGTGTIDSTTDVDMWSFTVAAGQRISFDIDRPSGSLDSYIRLFNSSGTQLASNDDGAGPGESSSTESYLEYTFSTGGTYYLGVSSYGNSSYDPVTGNGDSTGNSTGDYTLIVSPGLTGTIPPPAGFVLSRMADIQVYAAQGAFPPAIVSGKQTWVVIHGRNSSRYSTSGADIPRLAQAIANQRPTDQVLTLDWSHAAEDSNDSFTEEDWIQPVAQWAAAALSAKGISGSLLNLVGHSWGGNMTDEIAERITGGANTIVALDPAENGAGAYDPEALGQINFAAHSQFSWAFHSSTAGSESTSTSADEAIIVNTGYDQCDIFGGIENAHAAGANVFSYMLETPSGGVSSLFQLNRLLAHTSGPWVPDQYSTIFSCESTVDGYEAIINTTTAVNAQPVSINYVAAVVAVTVQANPSGRSFIVDGTTYATAQTFNWASGSSHTISTTSLQSGASGVQYVWSGWSDGGSISHTVAPTSGTTYTANFTTQYYLTMNTGTGGSVSPSSGWKDSGTGVSISATPNAGYSFSSWTGSGSGSYSGSSSSSSVTMNGPISETAAFTQNPISVTVQPSLSGRSFSVDGTPYTAAQSFSWIPGSSHTIATTSPQSGGTGIQYVWSSWSDAGAISHTVAPTTPTTYTANFTTQYYLTMSAGTGGTVSPSSGWYNNDAAVSISASPNSGYSFSSWTGSGSGSYSGSSSSSSVTMNAPITETASFTQIRISVTLQASPTGRSFSVDGTPYTSAQVFSWTPSSSHTIATTSPQNGSTGVQYVFSSWSDAGAISHTVSPASATTYTASFTTEYYLTMNAGAGGTVSPSSGWYNSGAGVSISATPNSGYSFSSWTGTGSGSYSGINSSSSVTMNAPISQAAAFVTNALPRLSAARQGSNFVLSWPTNDPAFKLFYATNLPATTWISNPVAPAIVSGQYTITNGLTNNFRLYRLKK